MPVKRHKRSVLLWRIPLGRWRWPRHWRRGVWTAQFIEQSVPSHRKRKSFTRVPGAASTTAFVRVFPWRCLKPVHAVSTPGDAVWWAQSSSGCSAGGGAQRPQGENSSSAGSVPRDSGGGRAVCFVRGKTSFLPGSLTRLQAFTRLGCHSLSMARPCCSRFHYQRRVLFLH